MFCVRATDLMILVTYDRYKESLGDPQKVFVYDYKWRHIGQQSVVMKSYDSCIYIKKQLNMWPSTIANCRI